MRGNETALTDMPRVNYKGVTIPMRGNELSAAAGDIGGLTVTIPMRSNEEANSTRSPAVMMRVTIPMRGNERVELEIVDARQDALVTIPMRGNEMLDNGMMLQGDGLGVTIPMRGNELSLLSTATDAAAGYDPHEG